MASHVRSLEVTIPIPIPRKKLKNWKPTTFVKSSRKLRSQDKTPPKSQRGRHIQRMTARVEQRQPSNHAGAGTATNVLFKCDCLMVGAEGLAWEIKAPGTEPAAGGRGQRREGVHSFLSCNSRSLMGFSGGDQRKVPSCFQQEEWKSNHFEIAQSILFLTKELFRQT